MTDKPTIKDLRTLRRNLPSKWWYGSEILGVLLDDLIERREQADTFVCPDCRAGYHAGPGIVGHGFDGRACTCGCDGKATARDLLTDPTGDET